MARFMDAYRKLSPQQKKWTHITVGIGVVLLFMTALSSMTSGEKTSKRGKPTISSVLTDKDPRQVGLDSLNSKQAEQDRKLTEIDRNLKVVLEKAGQGGELKQQIGDLAKAVDGLKEHNELNAQESEALKAANSKLQQDLEELRRQGGVGPKAAEAQEDLKKKAAEVQARRKYDAAAANPNQNQAEFFASAPKPVDEVVKPGQANRKQDDIKITSIGEEASAEEEEDKKEHEIYLPAGSIMSGALITGVDAPTGNGARRDPFPLLLRVKKEAVLPNRFRADVRECFIIASAFGDLSSERAYMRAETLSCVRDDGGVIESGIDAYATGEDGKAGVRGRLVSKQGAILARSLMAGFMQGVSEAFNVRSVPSINVTGVGRGEEVSPVYEQALNSQSMQGAAVSGAGKALERIADFYLEMAQNLYPVIEVDAAREIDFIVKKGIQLKLINKA